MDVNLLSNDGNMAMALNQRQAAVPLRAEGWGVSDAAPSAAEHREAGVLESRGVRAQGSGVAPAQLQHLGQRRLRHQHEGHTVHLLPHQVILSRQH